jgi:hypothetical protein
MRRAVALLLVLALAGFAAAQDAKDDPLASIKKDAQDLLAQDRIWDALKLYQTVVPSSLEPAAALELKTLIAQTKLQYATRLQDDRAKSQALEKEGKRREAAKALAPIAKYGSPEDKAAADADVKRLDEAAAKADEDAKKREEADKKGRLDALKKDESKLKAKIEAWLVRRRNLACSTCAGGGKIACSRCGGSGQIEIIIPSPTGSIHRSDPCTKCSATGKLTCDACHGKTYNTSQCEDILFKVYAPSVRERLQVASGCGSGKAFAQAMMDAKTASGVLAECVKQIGGARVPITGRDGMIKLEFEEADPPLVVCTLRLKYAGGDLKIETTRWRKQDGGEWFLEAPDSIAIEAKNGAGSGK